MDLVDAQGDTALLMAADNGHSLCVAALLAAGASAKKTQGSGCPLFLAAAQGHHECARLLKEAGTG